MNGIHTRNGGSWRGGMTRRTRHAVPAMIVTALMMMLIVGCSGDLSKSSSPVGLVVTNSQKLTRIDVQSGATGCGVPAADVTVRAILLQSQTNPNLPVDQRFNTVQLTGYRVSYQRRDGGTLVPAPFTRTISGSLEVGGSDTALN